MAKEWTYQELLSITSLQGVPTNEHVHIVGNLFDAAYDHEDIQAIKQAFLLAKEIDFSRLSDLNKVLYHYDLSNGWSYIRKLETRDGTYDPWSFQSENLTKEVFHLRMALSQRGFDSISKVRRCQVLTNLGSLMNNIGRFSEAHRLWHKALEIDPDFAMALANKGNGASYYARYLYDPQLRSLFVWIAQTALTRALKKPQYIHPEDRASMEQELSRWRTMLEEFGMDDEPALNQAPLGQGTEQKVYRKWCLDRSLFLHPLNDIEVCTEAGWDYIHLPPIVSASHGEPLPAFALFNTIKQEFVTARFHLFKAATMDGPHYSDEDVAMFDALPGLMYSYRVELMKTAFRMAYSVFDKIAYLTNLYFKLGIAAKDVSFRQVWYERTPKGQSLRTRFAKSDNWPLRGLFWLSKDIYEKEEIHLSVMEPDAKEINDLRNYLEHKSLQVISHHSIFPELQIPFAESTKIIVHDDLLAKTERVLNLAREAIIYTSLAIHREERGKPASSRSAMNVVLSSVRNHNRQ